MSKHELQHLDLELIQKQTSQCLVAVSSVMCSNKRLPIHIMLQSPDRTNRNKSKTAKGVGQSMGLKE